MSFIIFFVYAVFVLSVKFLFNLGWIESAIVGMAVFLFWIRHLVNGLVFEILIQEKKRRGK